MKVIIQIPCLNEEAQLGAVLTGLPRDLAGVDAVEWLVVDDGSVDGTIDVARGHGVDHVVRLGSHRGLAAAFEAGIDAALKLGADVVVNIDGDGQHFGADIPAIVAPVVDGRADVVIGDRGISTVDHFSRTKRVLQRLGGAVVRRASGTAVPDVTSGLRAYTRTAALALTVESRFSYTLDTIVQAGKSGATIAAVPVATGPGLRARSRLYRSVWHYTRRNGAALVRVYTRFEPYRVFGRPAVFLGCAAVPIWADVAHAVVVDGGLHRHLPALVLAGTTTICAIQLAALAVLAGQLAYGRALAASTLERVRRVELEVGVLPSRLEPSATGLTPPEETVGVGAELVTVEHSAAA